MAGTDRSKADATAGLAPAPAVILVRPQLGANIGASARAMLNFGLTELRIVAPRDGWPNEHAVKAAAGADELIKKAQIFDTVADAVADLDYVLATTARPRDMVKTVFTPEEGAKRLSGEMRAGGRPGVLFGAERMGLHNDDVALADAVITAPLNPGFSSLNLGQAVLLVSYEWRRQADETPVETVPMAGTRPARKDELLGFFEHLESVLDETGFLEPVEKRPAMVRNVRNMFQRSGLTEQEVRTLRGIVSALTKHAERRALARFQAGEPPWRPGQQPKDK
ncbi:MAG: RNA methyltransferase [Alphaproteobacteria bacterium]|nr:rRNA methyltransferase [Rhodobiaceae bacterium]MBO6543398.1 RNA methyltransferase [Alphaproteobacteria bacterium]MBO6627530.1 RNA methyltransferase [Alphaproteobacteria bacterium]MDF1627173.1 RNA methyltransferase [Parvibaculaceae bacterium]